MGFSGVIADGYGKGSVKSKFFDKVEILKSEKDKIYFNVYEGQKSSRYMLMRSDPESKDWLLYNYTPTRASGVYKKVPDYKFSYKSKDIKNLTPSNSTEV
jgi:hypothetical protein